MKQHGRGLLRVLAVLLIGTGGFCGYWWFYKFAPSCRTLDPKWYAAHSQREYWREVQKGIHRGRWFHDDGFTVGEYGDKSWAEWIMAHVTPGSDMGCMGGGLCHSASSMRYITNQDVGDNADAWLDWWDKHKSKSQEEWIAQGFRQRGFEIDVPPTLAQAPRLLSLLGNSETNKLTAIPGEMKYNAFRCLRDSGFEPVAYALSNRMVSAEIERGLLEYARMERQGAAARSVGIRLFGKKDEDQWEGMALPPMLKTRFQIMANTLSIGLPLFGVALLLLSFRRNNENVEPTGLARDGPEWR